MATKRPAKKLQRRTTDDAGNKMPTDKHVSGRVSDDSEESEKARTGGKGAKKA